MPTTRARRTLAAAPGAVWAVVGDPRALPRWWPRAVRVERPGARVFTLVLQSKRGREVRADQRVLADEAPWRRAWALEVAGTPFARVFAALEVEVTLAPAADGGTLVTIEERQRLRGTSKLGGPFARRGARRQLREALDGLQRVL